MRLKILVIFGLFFSFFQLSSCFLWSDFKQPEVLTYSPSGTLPYSKSLSVVISFSEPMEEAITEKAFSMQGDQNISGYFHWKENDTILTFTPSTYLNKGVLYIIKLSKEAEDKAGNDLIEALSFKFSFSTELDKPYLTAHYPGYDQFGISKTTNIILTFSEAMDKNSLIKGVTFSPSFQYYLIMTNANKTAIFKPLYQFNYAQKYTVKITTEVQDTNGNPLLEDYQFPFTIGSNFTHPVLIALSNASSTNQWADYIVNEKVEKDDSIILKFSKAVYGLNFQNYISFSPSMDGIFSSINSNTLQFTPSVNWELEQVYTMDISKSLPDVWGNELDKDYQYDFKINGTNSIAPIVNKISNIDSSDWVNNQYVTISPLLELTNVAIHFSQPMNQIKVIDNLSIQYVAGSGNSGISISQYTWSSDNKILILNMKDLDSNNTYLLRINGSSTGACDIKNNYLIEDYIIYFKT